MLLLKLLFTAVAVLVNAGLVVSVVSVVIVPDPVTNAVPSQIPSINCATVLCLLPDCESGQKTAVPEGQCCPICVTDCSQIGCAKPLCQGGEELVTSEGECCPECVPTTPDCSAVSCLLPVCQAGEKLVTPEGECCPECVPTTPDCLAVSCLLPICQAGEKRVVPPGECCPVCQPVCEIEGQIFSTCASACPSTCDDSGPKICPAVCIQGCTCPPGQVIDNVNNVCVTPDECPDPCATVRCANGYQCEVFQPTGEAFCQPNCSLNNGGCSANQTCRLQQVQCVRAPCPSVIECVDETTTTDCPPTCTMEFCSEKANRKKMCSNLNGPREIPGCTGPCQLTYCRTCYYDRELRSPPENCSPECKSLQDYLTDTRCFRRWSICVRKNQQLRTRGVRKTEENFRCHNPQCPDPLRG